MDKALIDLLFMSQKRKDVLLLLKTGGKTIEEITNALNVKSTGMLPQLKTLKEENLIFQENKEYKLTPLAEIIVEKMDPLINVLEVIEENSHYWEERDLTDLPEPFLERLDELKGYIVIRPDPDNIFEPPVAFLENIRKSRNIMVFSSIFHPIFPELFLEDEKDSKQVTLILTNRIFERLKTDFEKELGHYLSSEKKQLFIHPDEIKIAMVVKTELFMTADFLTLKGAFDQETLISFQPTSMNWAEDLILYFKDKAREI